MHLCRVRSTHKNRVEQSVEEAPFAILSQDKQHTQPRRRRATETPAPEEGRGKAARSAPRTEAAGGEGRCRRGGPGKRLVARRAANWRRDRERKGKGTTLGLADAQRGKAITIQNTESRGNQFNLLFRLSFPFPQKKKKDKKKIEKKHKGLKHTKPKWTEADLLNP